MPTLLAPLFNREIALLPIMPFYIRLLFAVMLLEHFWAVVATAEFTFVLVAKATDNPFFEEARDGCLDKARQLGVKCLYIGPNEEDAEKQANIIQQLLIQNETKIDGIALSSTSNYLTDVINEAIDFGIPVITFDSDCPSSRRIAYIGTDNFFFGGQIADVVKQLVPNGGTFAIVASSSTNIQDRINGFRYKLFRETPGKASTLWTELPGSPSNFEANLTLAMEQMHEFTQFNPTVIAPLLGAPMRSGMWQHFVDVHRQKNITLVSGDATSNQIDFLNRDYVQGLVGQLPYEMGSKAIESLLRLANEKELLQECIGTNVISHIKIPLLLPTLTVDTNLIGNLRFVGYILFGLVTVLCIAFATWTYRSRNLHVVQISQPIFLITVAVGVFVMASSLVPLSFDDGGYSQCEIESRCLHICMSIPWLISVGFVIAYSALFSKTMRINRIFHSKSKANLRVVVTEKDVMAPFFALMTVNVIVLVCWTVIDPLIYVREAHTGTDGWNRGMLHGRRKIIGCCCWGHLLLYLCVQQINTHISSSVYILLPCTKVISTYGSCQSNNEVPFLVPLVLVNVSVLALANWQAYEARHLESAFSEAMYITCKC